jgi:hypothetical protein
VLNGGSRLLWERGASAAGINRIVGDRSSVWRPATARQSCFRRCPLPGGSCDVGGDYVGGVPVEAAAGPLMPHRGSRIGMRGSLLHVAQRDPGIERGGDECVSERVWGDVRGDFGAACGLADNPAGAVPVQPPPVRGQEHRPLGALADGQVDRPGSARRQRAGPEVMIYHWKSAPDRRVFAPCEGDLGARL